MPPTHIRVPAPAKINLYLGVHTQRDAQGYHRVDSVMAALDLSDTVELSEADELSVVTIPDVGILQERNTAYRAAVDLGRALEREPLVRIGIEKHIPLCAGLGGPSTDAAAVLLGLGKLWGLKAEDPVLDEVARSVGVDVPFFLHGSPAYLSGRGDELEETFPLEDELPVVLVKPNEGGLSTADAYRRFDEAPEPLPPLEPVLQALRAGRSGLLPELAANNLAQAACALAPEIAEVLAWLRARPGVLAADVCGSGSCSYAICSSAGTAEDAAEAARMAGNWWSCATSMKNYNARTAAR